MSSAIEFMQTILAHCYFCHSCESRNLYNKNMYYIYILASQKNGTLYIGVTSNLIQRVHQHKTGAIEGFTKKYKVDLLVYYEETEDINSGIAREKNLKAWKRQWKIDLIEKNNPSWKDLYPEIIS